MMTRRDALNFAAAQPLAQPAMAPGAATTALDEPLDPGSAPARQPVWKMDPFDPASFADGFDGIDTGDLCDHIAAVEMAEYKQAREAVLTSLPLLRDVRSDHPWHKMDEAALGMWITAWAAGIRAGAAYENLRLALVGPRRLCRACHGIGRTGPAGEVLYGHHDQVEFQACATCEGVGTAPTPGVVPA